MSRKHPVISVTGSSGAGTTSVKSTFEQIFRRENVRSVAIEGDAFHRYDRAEMKKVMISEAEKDNPHFSHFGPDANLLAELEAEFKRYGESGYCRTRTYIHDQEEAELQSTPEGTFTPWQEQTEETDVLFYEGLHGAVVADDINVARYADLKIGVVPVINLEWIQKIHRDIGERGYSEDDVVDTILRRMHDYVHYLIPQFANTDINFQMAPVVDTSDPTFARNVPTLDECVVVIRFCDPEGMEIDFPLLLDKIKNSKMSRRNSIVVPGGKLGQAIELIMTPIFRRLMDGRG